MRLRIAPSCNYQRDSTSLKNTMVGGRGIRYPPRTPRGRPSAEELLEAAVAVGLVVLLLERALVKLLQAEGADEVLRVEFPEHGRYAATC
jgi:hypothetical protein